MVNWANKSDIEIHQSAQWTIQWGKVDHIALGKIYMAQPFWGITRTLAQWGIGMSYPQVMENAYELLDTEGEWYLNRTDGYLYYKPLAGAGAVMIITIPLTSMQLEATRLLIIKFTII